MKKLLLAAMVCFGVLQVTAQNNPDVKPRLSPMTKKYLRDLQTDQLPDGYVYKKIANGQLYLSTIIKVASQQTVQEKLDKLGAKVGTKAGDIWTVQVPVNKVIEFTQTTGVYYIQVDEPVSPQMDVARKTTRVDSVHSGINMFYPYTGKGVVVGIIDFGFDYTHPSLYDTLGSNYRVKKVWELNSTGTPPTGYSYGHELSSESAIKAQGTDNAEQTHGTCVAGMAAGSGFGGLQNGRKYRGMAYDAEMVFVGVRRDSIGKQWMQSGFSDFIDGVNYIFQYANGVSKPAVVNISWGSHSGPHDGSSLFNQACDNLSGAGKVVVMSAGNEGENKLHLSKTFSGTDTVVSSFLAFIPANYKRTWVDVWGETGKTFCGKVTLYNNGVGNTTDFVCIDDNVHTKNLMAANGTDTCYVDFITSSSEFNGKPRMTISIFNKAADSVAVSISGKSGTINMWDEYYYYGYPYKYRSEFVNYGQSWATNGNTSTTTSDMGSGKSVLLVGAYASKVDYTDIAGNTWSYAGYASPNYLVAFSSHGPTIDGRTKPDITAPGLTIATAVSSFDTAYTPTGSSQRQLTSSYVDAGSGKTYYYGEFTGTSASSPAAAGIVALLLEANKTLTPAQVQDIIATTAIRDIQTGKNLPNNDWGNGKINAYAAAKKAFQMTNVYNVTGKKIDCMLYPNPSDGKFSIDYAGNKAEDLKIEVLSVTGTVLSSAQWHVNDGINTRKMDLTGYAKGNYIINISNAEGIASIKTTVN